MGSSGRATTGSGLPGATALLVMLALINMAYAHHQSSVSVDVVGGEQMLLHSLPAGGAMHPVPRHMPTHPGKQPFCNGRVWVSVNATELLHHDDCTDGAAPAPTPAMAMAPRGRSSSRHRRTGVLPDCSSNWTGSGYEVSLEEFKGGRGESASAMLGHWRREHDGEEAPCAWVEIPTHTGDKVMLCVRCEDEQASVDRDDDEVKSAPPPKAPLGRPMGREMAEAQLARFRIRIKIKIKVEIRIFRN